MGGLWHVYLATLPNPAFLSFAPPRYFLGDTLLPSTVMVVRFPRPRRPPGRYFAGSSARMMYTTAINAKAVTTQNCQSCTGISEGSAAYCSSRTTSPSRSNSTSRESSS